MNDTTEFRLAPREGGRIILMVDIGQVLDAATTLREEAETVDSRYLSIEPGGVDDPTVLGLGFGVPGVTAPAMQVTIETPDPEHVASPMGEVAKISAALAAAWQPHTGVVDTCGLGLAFWAAIAERPEYPKGWRPLNLSGQRLASNR